MSEPLLGAKIKRAKISTSALGDTAIVAAVPAHSIRVLNYTLAAAGAVSVKWRSAANDLTGVMPLAANGQLGASGPDCAVLDTNPGEALVLNLSAAVAVGGHITYVEV